MRGRIARRNTPLGIEDAARLQLFVARGANRVPAVAVLALIARDVFFQGVQRPVGRGVGYMQEERLFGGGVFVQHLDGVIGYGVGEVVA